MNKNKFQKLSWFVIGAIAILASGTTMAWWTMRTLTPIPEVTPSPAISPTPIPQSQSKVQIYWTSDSGSEVTVVSRPILLDARLTPEQQLNSAFADQLLGSPPPASLGSAIPDNTKILNLQVKPEGVFINLSADFKSGGGSASMIGRLAQVVYTASSLDPNVPVWISVEGEPLELLGEEGLMVDQPMTRQVIEGEFLSP